MAKKPTRRKYRNKPCIVNGKWFPSQREGKYYAELLLREKAGEVSGIIIHPRYPIKAKGIVIRTIVPDFDFYDWTIDRRRTVDVKGHYTAESKRGHKLLKQYAGIAVEIVK